MREQSERKSAGDNTLPISERREPLIHMYSSGCSEPFLSVSEVEANRRRRLNQLKVLRAELDSVATKTDKTGKKSTGVYVVGPAVGDGGPGEAGTVFFPVRNTAGLKSSVAAEIADLEKKEQDSLKF